MAGLDSNTKLLLHCNGADGSTTFTDVSDSAHTVNVTATVEVDTAIKKWGTGAALFDGDSGYFSIDDSADWDIFASTTDDWSIDLCVALDLHDATEVLIDQYEDANNRWNLAHVHGSGLSLYARNTGGTMVQIAGGEITDTDFHHVLFTKVGDKIGLYLDGTQTAYAVLAAGDTFTGSLRVGRSGEAGAFYTDGNMDEIRVQHSNYFGAAPNDTPDDTITVPTAEYSLAWNTKRQAIFME